MSLDLEGLLSLHATVPSTGIEKETRLQELARHVPGLVRDLRAAEKLSRSREDDCNVLNIALEHWVAVAARLEQELAKANRVIAEQNRIVFDPVSDYYGEIRVQFEGLQQNLAEVTR